MAKKYTLGWEGDKLVSVEVDGVSYSSPDEIPDAEDRANVWRLVAKSSCDGFEEGFGDEFAEDFREMERQAARFPRVIAGVFLGVAALMLAIAGISAFMTAQRLLREESAEGRVVDYVVRPDDEGADFYYPVVEFDLPNGSRQTVQLSEGSWPPAYSVGQTVTVRYDPAQPLHARIKSAASTALAWLVSIITGVLGAAFLFAAWLTRRVFATGAEAEAED